MRLAASKGAKACGLIAAVERGGLAALDLRRGGEVDPEARDDAVARAFEQDAGELGVAEHQVVGPFEAERDGPGAATSTASISASPAASASAGAGGSPSRSWIDGRAEEIAVERFPRAAVAPAPGVLAQRDQPVALDRERIGEQGAVGRADLLDDADAAQNSDPAAVSVMLPSGPMSR